jgi:hypothetical protein
MAYDIPYHRHPGFRPPNDLLPGNDSSENPVEFDLAPAWGGDLARIRSIMSASIGLVNENDWSPATQAAVIAAFETGAPAYVNTVEAVRGLTIPAAMAFRAGLITDLPKVPGTLNPDPAAKVAVTTGVAFSRICGAVPAMALAVAMKIMEISAKSEAIVADSRFFVQPSGSGGTGTPEAAATTAGSARPTPRRRGTAGKAGRRGR